MTYIEFQPRRALVFANQETASPGSNSNIPETAVTYATSQYRLQANQDILEFRSRGKNKIWVKAEVSYSIVIVCYFVLLLQVL